MQAYVRFTAIRHNTCLQKQPYSLLPIPASHQEYLVHREAVLQFSEYTILQN